MPLYTIKIKHSGLTNNIRYEKGMSVDVVTPTTTNPVTSNGGQIVVAAFIRIYGLDIKKAGLLNMSYLEVRQK